MKSKKSTLFIAVLIAVIGIGAVWFFYYPNSSTSLEARQRALKEAKQFGTRPGDPTKCTAVETPAKHVKSGATYIFTSGCIPDGWEVLLQHSQ